MGTTRGQDIKYECDTCLPEGCEGHVMRMDFSRTSDIMTFYLDNKSYFCCDPSTWKAMLLAEEHCG